MEPVTWAGSGRISKNEIASLRESPRAAWGLQGETTIEHTGIASGSNENHVCGRSETGEIPDVRGRHTNHRHRMPAGGARAHVVLETCSRDVPRGEDRSGPRTRGAGSCGHSGSVAACRTASIERRSRCSDAERGVVSQRVAVVGKVPATRQQSNGRPAHTGTAFANKASDEVISSTLWLAPPASDWQIDCRHQRHGVLCMAGKNVPGPDP